MKTGVAIIWRGAAQNTSKSLVLYLSAPSDKWKQVVLYFGAPPRKKKQAKALRFISRRRRINQTFVAIIWHAGGEKDVKGPMLYLSAPSDK
jgi:hypothetical protein